MVANRMLKTKENLRLLAIKMVAVAYERWSHSYIISADIG